MRDLQLKLSEAETLEEKVNLLAAAFVKIPNLPDPVLIQSTDFGVFSPADAISNTYRLSLANIGSFITPFLDINTDNLQFTSNQLNTIQDIFPSANPTFNDMNLTGDILQSKTTFFPRYSANLNTTYIFPREAYRMEIGAFDNLGNPKQQMFLEVVQTDGIAPTDSSILNFGVLTSGVENTNYLSLNGITGTIDHSKQLVNLIGAQTFFTQIILNIDVNLTLSIVGKSAVIETTAAGPVTITIPFGTGLPIGAQFQMLKSDGSPDFTLKAAAGVFLNGVDSDSITITDDFDRLICQQYAANEWYYTLLSEPSGTITTQIVYDNSNPSPIVITSAGKHAGYIGTEASFVPPSMTLAQADALTLPPNGSLVFLNDSDRLGVNTATPGLPDFKKVAYIEDIELLSEDVSFGIAYINTAVAVTPTVVVQGVPTKLLGTFITDVNGNVEFTSDATGRLTYTGTQTRTMSVTIPTTLSLASNIADVQVFAAKNGTIIANSEALIRLDGTSNSPKAVTAHGYSIDMTTNDYVEVFVVNLDNSSSITAYTCTITAHTMGGNLPDSSTVTWNETIVNGDGTATQTAQAKPIAVVSTDNSIIPTYEINQTSIPLALQTVGQLNFKSKSSVGADIDYATISAQSLITTDSAEAGQIKQQCYTAGTQKTISQYRGDIDVFQILSNTSFANQNVSDINQLTQNIGTSTFNNGQSTGLFKINTQSVLNAYTLDYGTGIANYTTPLTLFNSQAGVNCTLGSSLVPKQNYTAPNFELMWTSFTGTNTINAFQFPINHTINIEAKGPINTIINGSVVLSDAALKVEFGAGGVNGFQIQSSGLDPINLNTTTKSWFLTVSITRVSINEIRASAAGHFVQNNGNISPINFPSISLSTYAYNEAIANDILISFRTGISTGSFYDFVANTLTITQYTAP